MQSLFCQSGWTYYSNKCYRLSTNKKEYSNAENSCKIYDSTLAVPNSAEEHYFINSTITLGEESFVN